uniref:Uncharacterized protein n=1 Tax=viral metagenome TaxID=1070528 RepID=A0A6H1ZG98_9ZZZZ
MAEYVYPRFVRTKDSVKEFMDDKDVAAEIVYRREEGKSKSEAYTYAVALARSQAQCKRVEAQIEAERAALKELRPGDYTTKDGYTSVARAACTLLDPVLWVDGLLDQYDVKTWPALLTKIAKESMVKAG